MKFIFYCEKGSDELAFLKFPLRALKIRWDVLWGWLIKVKHGLSGSSLSHDFLKGVLYAKIYNEPVFI